MQPGGLSPIIIKTIILTAINNLTMGNVEMVFKMPQKLNPILNFTLHTKHTATVKIIYC